MTDENCTECDGEGTVEYLISVDDTKTMDCEKCNDGASDFDEDRAYDEHRDQQIELEESKRDAYD